MIDKETVDLMKRVERLENKVENKVETLENKVETLEKKLTKAQVDAANALQLFHKMRNK